MLYQYVKLSVDLLDRTACCYKLQWCTVSKWKAISILNLSRYSLNFLSFTLSELAHVTMLKLLCQKLLKDARKFSIYFFAVMTQRKKAKNVQCFQCKYPRQRSSFRDTTSLKVSAKTFF